MGEARSTELAEPAAISSSFSVANINPGLVRAEFFRAIRLLEKTEQVLQHTHDPQTPRVQLDQVYDQVSGPYLDDERNRCVEWFLNETTSDRLLFIDSDIGFKPDDAFDLIALATVRDLWLLGGVYMNAWSNFPSDTDGTGTGPVAYHWADGVNEGDPPYFAKIPWKEVDAHPDQVMEVDAIGTGFLSIHRDLLNKVGTRYGRPTPWFAEVSLHGVHLGEDMTFCQRAALEGHRPHLATRILVDHYKTCMIRPIPTETPTDG